MNEKRCPYYEDSPVKSCNAVLEGIKVPTRREIEWFCLGEHHEECPTYIIKEKEVKGFYKKGSQTNPGNLNVTSFVKGGQRGT